MLYPLGNRLSGDSGYVKPVLSAGPRLSVQQRKDEVRFSGSPSSSNRPKSIWPKWLEGFKGCWRGKPEAAEVEAEVGGRPLHEHVSAVEKPLHAQMGQELKRISDKQYQNAIGRVQKYAFKGECLNYYIGLHPPLHIQRSTVPHLDLQKIFRMVQEKTKGEIRILDIGCGAGEFIKAAHAPGCIKAYGVTAEGFTPPANFPEEQYIHGNAQNLLNLMSDKQTSKPGQQGKFDMIVSQKTFCHLVDPLGVLTQAYELLKPGGLLIVDRLNGTEIDEHVSKVNQYLEKKGFQAYFFQEPNRQLSWYPKAGPIIIQKSAHLPILDLPVRYGDVNEGTLFKRAVTAYQLDTEKLEAAGVTTHTPTEPEPWDHTLERFHHVRQKLGIPDECVVHLDFKDGYSGRPIPSQTAG